MPFSDTSNLTGLIQRCEKHTGLGSAAISGDTTKLKQFTVAINEAFNDLMPLLLSYCDKMRWDDINHTDKPIGTANLTSGQADYSFAVDDNSLDILNITGVRILQSSSGVEYVDLERMYLDDPNVHDAMSPNPSNTGIPSYFLETNNMIYLYPEPNFSATSGIKIFFEREASYFTSSDTTKEPGIPKPFHSLLALIASHEWVVENLDDPKRLTRLEARIAEKKQQLSSMISTRNPVNNVMYNRVRRSPR